jgi:formylglycine-generating enzyme required for sulfatase activity
MRLISTCFLFIVLSLSLFGCFSSRKRGKEVDSGFGGTGATIGTGGVSGIDIPIAGPGGMDSGQIVVGGSSVSRFDAAYVDAEVARDGNSSVARMGGASGVGIKDDAEIDGSPCVPNCPDLDWVTIEGGSFQMGSADGMGLDNQYPQHEVTVPSFEILKTEVTIAQYRRCFDAGVCSEPIAEASAARMYDSIIEPQLDNEPIVGVDWYQARVFAQWVGGRLPSEAEWEYAARSGGQDILYPWGNEEASCDHAVFGMISRLKLCDGWGPMPVCSKPLGNTAQGLCDMSGNVDEWVEDDWHESYSGAPSDGQAWIDNPRGVERIARGGAYSFVAANTAWRNNYRHDFASNHIGFRVVLDLI